VRQVGLNIRSDFERRVVIESRGVDRRNIFGQEILHVKDVVGASEYDTIGAPPAEAELLPTAKLAFSHEDKVANNKVSERRLGVCVMSARRGTMSGRRLVSTPMNSIDARA
jgi:hypothetical protein